MKNSRKCLTYIMFTKKGRGIDRIVGPLFETEIHLFKHVFKSKKINVVEETFFAHKYPKQYSQHLISHWSDKLFCYFRNNNWCGIVEIRKKDEIIIGKWFILYALKDKDGHYFEMSTTPDHNHFFAAKLREDFRKMGYDVTDGTDIYVDDRGRWFTGSNAISRILADELIEHMCLT